jgi:polysaccharide biosynthesis PFTS motif protein
MVWYSNNSLPFNKIGHKSIAPSVATNADYIDHHYVWSKSHKEYLEYRYPKASITVVGPILFEPLDPLASKQLAPKGILYFDVTPFDNLDFETFYTTKMCSEALGDIAQVAQELGVQLELKPKRPYLRNQGLKYQHSVSYLAQLDQLESEKMLTQLDSGVSITESILNCQVVIGLPFTSPILAASRLNRPSIYYAPLVAGDWDIPSERDGILVLRGKRQLIDYLISIIQEDRQI